MTLIFSTSNHFLSRLIRIITGSRCSHVALGLMFFGVPVVVEASLFGVVMLTRARWELGKIVVAEFECPEPFANRMPNAVQNLGARYDYAGLLGFVPVLIARALKKTIKNPFASPNALVCSELVASLDPLGTAVEAFRGLDAETVTPDDLHSICTFNWEIFKKVEHGPQV